MTEVLSGLTLSLLGNHKDSHYHAMSPDHSDSSWRQHYYHPHQQQHQQQHPPQPPQPNSMPMLSSQWTTQGPSTSVSHGPALGGMAEVDLRMFHQDHPVHYVPATTYGNSSQLLSPTISYVSETTWPSDVDMGTPSTAGFPADIPDGFHPSLRLHSHAANSTHSPHSSVGEFSPHASRPTHSDPAHSMVGRPITVPEHAQPNHVSYRRTPTDTIGFDDLNGAIIKRLDASEDRADGFAPGPDENNKIIAAHRASTSSTHSSGAAHVTSSNRGRKRQRIPHTAVERRYRENLNAHLDKLRQTVPAFNQASTPHLGVRGDEVIIDSSNADASSANAIATSSGMRPSKCEVLNGAIEHILSLDKENGALKTENKALRQRLDEVERWYHQQSHSGTPGPVNR